MIAEIKRFLELFRSLPEDKQRDFMMMVEGAKIAATHSGLSF